jgi:GT2 family glycosyltransferase/tetratricopeptide (TPR) repeat protein
MVDPKKKLGLNLIVGAGEAKILERCLKSAQGIKFDEIVVTHATRMEDAEVMAIAQKYATKVARFEWNDNFSDARNYSFSQSEAGHILWVDSDDVIKESEHAKINAIIPELDNIDVALFDYVYSHDDKDRPVLVLPRERLVRNTPKIKWNDPIHEYLNMDGSMKIKRFDVKIDHYRDRPYDPQRNLTLLKKEYDKGEATARISFYYGKELADVGKWEEALPVLEKFVKKGEGFVDNLTVGCIRLSRYYMEKNDRESARNYAMLGIRYNAIYAENFVTLASINELDGKIEEAITYYKEALTRTLSGGMSQLVDYYGFIPACKLGAIYLNKRLYTEALKYAEIALKHKPDHPEAQRLKATIEDQMKKFPEGTTIEQKDIDDLSNFFRNRKLLMEVLANDGLRADLRLKKRKDLKVVWLIPVCDASNPSVRLRRLIIHEKLKSLKVDSRIVEGYQHMGVQEVRDKVGDANIVVFTSFGKHELDLMRDMHASGRKVAFDHCEGIFGFPFEDDCMHEADAILCCSSKLEEMTRTKGFKHTTVLKDSVEEREPKKSHQYLERERPKACFLGMGGNSFLVSDYLKDVISAAGYDLVLITEWDNATIKWNPDTWPDDLTACDVALCPQRVDVQPGKSSVKATTAMAFGMPVIASPLQAYKEVIVHGENGYIAETKEDWKKALLALKDVNVRRRIGKAAKKAVAPYRIHNNIQNYVKFFDCLVNDTIVLPHAERTVVSSEKARDVVDLIIPSYNNLEYLKMCLVSVRLNTLHPFHIVISDAGSGPEMWEYLKTLKGITVLGAQGKRLTFSEACNAGIEASRSKFFVIMNSDIIVSKGWLTNMVRKMETVGRLASCGVLSNCDLGWLHSNPRVPNSPVYPMRLEKAGIDLHPGMKREEIEPHLDELYAFMEASNEKYKDVYTSQEWVAAYCTIYARSAVNEVGLFDTRFKNGCEDLDLGMRLGRAGFACGQSIGSFVFHFGGVTRGAYQAENKESYDKEDFANHAMLKDKWKKPRIAIFTGPAWEPWNRQKVDEGMAGSETWAAYLARAFVKRGFEVTVYNDLLAPSKSDVVLDPVDEGGTHYGDVRYVDHTKMQEDIRYLYIDYFIASRSTEPLKHSLHAGKHYVMIHDVWLNGDPNYDVVAWKTQGYAYLSEWHKKFLLGHHKQLPPEKMFLTANGVVQELYAGVRDEDKQNMSVYSSSPDRGLYQLLQMMPEIRKAVPDFTLKICYGFLNWEESCKKRNDQRGMAFIQKIKAAMEQPGVEYLGRVNKKTLAEHQKKAKVWLFPTWFDETHCITAVEAGLSHNAILSTDKGGLKTTVGSAGILLPPDGLSMDGEYPKSYTEKFIAEAIKLFTDEGYRLSWADKAREKMLPYNWDRIADDWIKRFTST